MRSEMLERRLVEVERQQIAERPVDLPKVESTAVGCDHVGAARVGDRGEVSQSGHCSSPSDTACTAKFWCGPDAASSDGPRCSRPILLAKLKSEHQALANDLPAPVLDLLDLGHHAREMIVGRELDRGRAENIVKFLAGFECCEELLTGQVLTGQVGVEGKSLDGVVADDGLGVGVDPERLLVVRQPLLDLACCGIFVGYLYA